MKRVRVRYAPSPTGLLHIGNARSALFNFLYARHYDGDFIIRIEDTDVARNVKDGETSQLGHLKWLGLDWDESPDIGGAYGPYRQLERLEHYQTYANQLLAAGLAYKEYRDDSDRYAVRFKVPDDVEYCFDDMVRGSLRFQSRDIEDWIIMKDNGIPTYNFAVTIDDHMMAITHVLRGEEHITNTPKQMMIYQAFGWEIPTFGHMTLIVNEQRKKLSKRDENVIQFISEYEAMGYLPEAMFNFIALLGWSPPIEEEILSKDDIINHFDPGRLSKAPAMFDKDKLAYINSRYIKMLDIDALAMQCRPYLEHAGIAIPDDHWLKLLAGILQDRMTHMGQIVDLHHAFFHGEFTLDEEGVKFMVEHQTLPLLTIFKQQLETVDFSVEKIEQTIKNTGLETQTKGKPLFMGLRIATTGETHGPSLPVTLALLGKERVRQRLEHTIQTLRGES